MAAMKPAHLVPLAIVLASGLASCAGGVGAPEGPSTTSPMPPSSAAGSVVSSVPVPEVLDFTADRLGGGTIEGADYAGSPLAIWFWAPW